VSFLSRIAFIASLLAVFGGAALCVVKTPGERAAALSLAAQTYHERAQDPALPLADAAQLNALAIRMMRESLALRPLDREAARTLASMERKDQTPEVRGESEDIAFDIRRWPASW